MRRASQWFLILTIALSLFTGLGAFPAIMPSAHAAGVVSLTSFGAPYTQDFNTLASSGTTNTIVPTGWDFSESGSNANTTYRAGTGSDNTGDTYSFGASTNTDRAFGGLRSGNLVPLIGAQFANNTGGTIESLAIMYTGEQWRLGQNTTGRSADRLDFQFSTSATSLTSGTWVDYDSLDFSSPIVAGTVGALNGNVAPNRTALSFTITGLSIQNGATFWVRWADTDLIPGADDGLSVDDISLTPSGTVVVMDSAPTVASTVPANEAIDVLRDASMTVTFSEPVNVTGTWFDLTCANSGSHAAVVSGGPTVFTINPDIDFAYSETCTLTVTAENVTDQDTNDPPDAMEENFSTSFTTAADVCTLAFTPIYSIQGSGPTAAITGAVTTMGVVVGDHEGASPALRGFYLQDLNGDGNPATSDGIFVFNANNDSVSLGDVVRVTGAAAEFENQTQLSAVTSLVKCGIGTVAPTDVTLPVPYLDYLEQYEGMLVRLPQTLYVTEHFQLGRFGQVVLSSGGRLMQPTNIYAPGPEAAALQDANNLNRIIVDDSLNNQNSDPIVFGRGGLPLSASNTLRGGDTATGIVGVMTYTWAGNAASGNAYRVRPINALAGSINFEPANPRPESAPALEGTMRVAGMNLLNFFNTFTGCTTGVGGTTTDCRGAENQTEYDRQLSKTVAAIVGTKADVVGLVEVENDGYGPTSALAALVDALNVATTPGTYAFIDADAGTGQVNALGVDAIKVGLIYKPARVTPIGTTAALNTAEFVSGGDGEARNRPALAQAFEEKATGGRFVVAVNHLKSKGSACATSDAGDGQGNCNEVRTNAANLLWSWLDGDPTQIGDTDAVIVGDLNSYAKEDPIEALKAAGYSDLKLLFGSQEAYSYAFDGQWGYLDHALSSHSLTPQVAAVFDWHINADEPSVLDYNTNFKSAGQISSLYARDEFRIADHDPVLIDLKVCDEIAPTLSVTVSPDMLWPPNHKYVDITATVTAADNFDPNPTVTLVSVTSNEPDNGLGDGDTPNDIVIGVNNTFKLRAERSGTGTGRIYTITYMVSDACGNSTTASATVTVPLNKGK